MSASTPMSNHLAHAVDALAEEDVELGLLKGRGHLVLDHLDPGAVAHVGVAGLDFADAPDVQAQDWRRT